MKLTNNFTLQEFIHSATAVRLHIPNQPGPQEQENIRRLAEQVLQPLRDKYGGPLTITSGYRCVALNKAVGGVATSQHLTGEAADVCASDPRRLLAELIELQIPFDQAILYPTFLHISYCTARNRRQVLYAKGVQP